MRNFSGKMSYKYFFFAGKDDHVSIFDMFNNPMYLLSKNLAASVNALHDYEKYV